MKKLSLIVLGCFWGISLYAQQTEEVTLAIGGEPWNFQGNVHPWSGNYEFEILPGGEKFIKLEREVQGRPAGSYDMPNTILVTVTALKPGKATLKLKHTPGIANMDQGESVRTIIFNVIATTQHANLKDEKLILH